MSKSMKKEVSNMPSGKYNGGLLAHSLSAQAHAIAQRDPSGREARRAHESASREHELAARAAKRAGDSTAHALHRRMADNHKAAIKHEAHKLGGTSTPSMSSSNLKNALSSRATSGHIKGHNPRALAAVQSSGTGKRGGAFIVVGGKKLYGKQREAFLRGKG